MWHTRREGALLDEFHDILPEILQRLSLHVEIVQGRAKTLLPAQEQVIKQRNLNLLKPVLCLDSQLHLRRSGFCR